jgi:hypothetical protein
MNRGVAGAQPLASGLPALVALVGFVMIGCTETHPEPNVELGSVLDSRTHEADSLRQIEERQE